MAIIDCVIWQPQGNEVIYAYKFPHNNLSTYTQLVVQESQEALLFSKGKLMGKFGPGKHVLNTENLPILRNLFGIPFGGKNPFTAEVWFVNKVQTFAIDWVIDKMPIHDVDYNTQLPLVACGTYGLRIEDSEKFLVKLVGTRNQFTQHDMTEQSYGEFSSKAKTSILQFMIANKIGYKQISAFLNPIGENLRTQMADFWCGLGLELTKFYITSIDIDGSTPEGLRIKEAIAQQASMSITGHTWQQEQMFGTANNAISNMGGIGGNGGLLGGLMAVQMMNGMGGGNLGGGMMNPQYQQPTFGGSNNNSAQTIAQPQQVLAQAKTIYCAQCSHKFTADQAFCPNCGKRYTPCPRCGADNADNAKRCVSCGASLQASSSANTISICPKCGTPLTPGARFCANCGTPIQVVNENVCPRCGAEMLPTAKFCPKCGSPRGK